MQMEIRSLKRLMAFASSLWRRKSSSRRKTSLEPSTSLLGTSMTMLKESLLSPSNRPKLTTKLS